MSLEQMFSALSDSAYEVGNADRATEAISALRHYRRVAAEAERRAIFELKEKIVRDGEFDLLTVDLRKAEKAGY